MSKLLISTFCVLFCLQLGVGQNRTGIARSSALFQTMKQQDSLLFELAFHQLNEAGTSKLVHDDFEFYHDQSGVTNSKERFLKGLQSLGKLSYKPIRKLVKNSMRVFPLYNNGKLYGAIQKGVHRFYAREKGKPEYLTSTAKFTHLWVKQGKQWLLKRVLSYDHYSPSPAQKKAVAEQTSQDQNPVKQKATKKKLADKSSEIEALLQKSKVPALGLGIIENGKLTKVQVYGKLDGQKTAAYNTIFKVASLTKPVFALTVLKLIDQGKIALDEPLHKYWIDPEIAKDKRYKKLTPKLVLTHQTGFPNWRYLTKGKKLVFQFDPGTRYQYSGEGFEYLRKAIEKKLKKPIEQIAQELLFKPAGMTDTRFWWDKTMDESRYAQNFDAKGKQIATEKYYKANAAANLLTTVEDYGKFLTYVLNGAGVSDKLFQEMQKSQVQLKANDYFGLGWEILTNFSNDETALLHSGRDPGVNTLAVIFPKSKNGFLIFMNGDNVMGLYEKLLKQDLYLGKELWNKQ